MFQTNFLKIIVEICNNHNLQDGHSAVQANMVGKVQLVNCCVLRNRQQLCGLKLLPSGHNVHVLC